MGWVTTQFQQCVLRACVYAGKQPDVMDFYVGYDGLNMSNNVLSHLNNSSPYDGPLRRWYCRGPCYGRFATVLIPDSMLASLKGCLLSIFLWFRKYRLLLLLLFR